MSFRKLFKKLCIFGSVASLALGLFAGSAKAAAPTASTSGVLYGNGEFQNENSTDFTAGSLQVKDRGIRLIPNLPLNHSLGIEKDSNYADRFLDYAGMTSNPNPKTITVTPYSKNSENKYVAGTLNSEARGINVYVRAQKQGDTSTGNYKWYLVGTQNANSTAIATVTGNANENEGIEKFKLPSDPTPVIGDKWDIYYFIDGGDTYADTDKWY